MPPSIAEAMAGVAAHGAEEISGRFEIAPFHLGVGRASCSSVQGVIVVRPASTWQRLSSGDLISAFCSSTGGEFRLLGIGLDWPPRRCDENLDEFLEARAARGSSRLENHSKYVVCSGRVQPVLSMRSERAYSIVPLPWRFLDQGHGLRSDSGGLQEDEHSQST